MRSGFAVTVLSVFSAVLFLFSATACSLIQKKPADEPDEFELARRPIPPERAGEVASTAASDWFYGEGLGDTAITAGAVVAFPPYLAVVLGNAALSLTGYEPITVSKILPKDAGKTWDDTYSAVASSPGRLSAAVAGREFKTQPVIKDDMQRILKDNTERQNDAPERARGGDGAPESMVDSQSISH